jgi:hypothetical protein
VRPAAKSEEYALGVHGLELADAMMKAGRKRAGVWSMGANALSHEYWGQKGDERFSVEDLNCCGFSPEEIAILSAHLRSLRPSGKGLMPGRGRGRPSIHGKAMTRRHRARSLHEHD